MSTKLKTMEDKDETLLSELILFDKDSYPIDIKDEQVSFESFEIDDNISADTANDMKEDEIDFSLILSGTDIYSREIEKIPILSQEKELEFAKLCKEGTEEEKKYAFERLVIHNLRYVRAIASRYQNLGVPLEDLIQEGNLGLLKAVERYDPYSGYRFTTYATWWIRQAIGRYISNQGRTIRLPVHVVGDIQKLKKAENKLTQINTTDEMEWLCNETGFDTQKIIHLRHTREDIRSLDMPVSNDNSGDGDSVLIDFIADQTKTTPEDIIIKNDLSKQLNEIMSCLTDKERQILSYRLGLEDDQPLTLEEVGRIFNITRERVRQIEAKALRKLRNPKYSKQLANYITQ